MNRAALLSMAVGLGLLAGQPGLAAPPPPADLYGVKDADVVPSGVAELARLQGQGFVYIHP